MYMERCVNERDIDFRLDLKTAVFTLTHLPEARDKYNWILTSENYERICVNKNFKLGFWASRRKKLRQRPK